LQLRECTCGDAVFTDTVRLAVYLPLSECDAVLSELAELTGAKAVCEKKECLYIG
jgi:hypothetical protein